ncbi:unnamed protein product, partial [Phaeothamnion confervicola]
MVKVWKTFVHQDGMVTRHLSPFEQSIVPPLLKSMPEKVRRNLLKIGSEVTLRSFDSLAPFLASSPGSESRLLSLLDAVPLFFPSPTHFSLSSPKALMRFKEHAPYIIPPMLVLVGTIVWMDY